MDRNSQIGNLTPLWLTRYPLYNRKAIRRDELFSLEATENSFLKQNFRHRNFFFIYLQQ